MFIICHFKTDSIGDKNRSGPKSKIYDILKINQARSFLQKCGRAFAIPPIFIVKHDFAIKRQRYLGSTDDFYRFWISIEEPK